MPEQASRRTIIVLVMLVLATGAAVAAAVAADPSQPTSTTTSQSTPTTTAVELATTTVVVPTAATGPGPNTFVTRPAPGPVQVLVVRMACVGYAGDGWKVTWRITNQGRPRTGAVVAHIDVGGPALPLVPSLTLPAGGDSGEQTQVVVGGGESIMVTWTLPDRPVQSFPLSLPSCPTDPADLADARKATTTT
jgi:hypothetical protein